jgi:ribosomal protein S18 acetylase RimI-like enzyme
MLSRLVSTDLVHTFLMAITYYKRLRMEIDLEASILPATLPGRFGWVPWEESLLADHAEVKYQSFRGEIDAYVFPCLGDRYGCQRLMREIRRKPGFLPSATWLIACPEGYVGTVQGIMDYGPIGAIQNVGVLPEYRGIGLGRALVHRALAGFLLAGLRRAYLEVTAENGAAVGLYRSLGFRRAKTLYKAVDG